MKKVMLHFGKGSIRDGFEAIVVELFLPHNRYPIRVTGSLPPAPKLAMVQQQWQSLYLARQQDQSLRIQLLQHEGSRYSDDDFFAACEELKLELNDWLRSNRFQAVEQMLRTELGRLDEIQVIVETWDSRLHKLPWHLWHFFEDYPKAEATLSGEDWRELSLINTNTDQARVLAVFGSSQAIDTQTDFDLLRQLPKTELTTLASPGRQLLNERLWQDEGWDIFFFAGHSQTEGDQGRIYLSDHENLTVPQLKNALSRAIANGLKIAIFNSCDGLGLAQQLSDLQIPYVVVMREPVPDQVAHQFLNHFLRAFSAGATFHLAVREARQRLEGVEGELPCATWLPVVWQNPAAPPLRWSDLCCQPTPSPLPAPSDWWGRVLASAGVGALILLLRITGLLQSLELSAYDWLMRQRPVEPIDSRIVVVEISQDDTNQHGYPLPDDTLATLFDRLIPLQPAAIGMDLHRPQARTPGYQQLMTQFETHPNLFMVCSYSARDRSYEPPASFSPEQISRQVGFSDVLIDDFVVSAGLPGRSDLATDAQQALSNQVVRRHLLSYDASLQPSPSNCITPYSFSFQLAFEYLYRQGVSPLGVSDEQLWQFGPAVLRDLPRRFGGYQNLEADTSQILLNYRSNQPGQRLTLEQVLAGDVDLNLVKNHIVMIGYTAPVSRDYFQTPYGSMPGVWVHAHMVSQLVSAVQDQRPLVKGLPQWYGWQWGDSLWVLGWAIGSGWVMAQLVRRSQWYGWGAIALIEIGLYQLSLFVLVQGIWLPWIPTALSIIIVASLIGAWPYLPVKTPVKSLKKTHLL